MPVRFFTAGTLALAIAAAWPAAGAAAADAAAPAGRAAAQGQARALLAVAEQPLRLIRGATLYQAGAGVALQKDDILETGAGAAHVQVGAGPDAIVALGPQTRVLIAGLGADGKTGIEVALLRGWVKVQAADGKGAQVATPALLVTLAAGSTIVRSADGKDAVFAEDGRQQAARAGVKDAVPLQLAPEQYAEVDPSKPQPVPGRPPRAFVGAMPAPFRDRLVRAPAVANAGKAAPLKQREVAFADVEDWLAAPLPARRGFVARFRPRLADPAFRAGVERAFGQSGEWKTVLHPARPVRATDNRLF